MSRLLIFTAFCSLLISPIDRVNAQGVPGNWKRTALTLIESSGKTTDMTQLMGRSMPCMKDITYTFTQDGHTKATVPDACGRLKESIERMNADGAWVVSGRKLTVTSTNNELPPAVYGLSVEGNTMTWVFNYADNPKTPNPTKAQRLTIVYQRV